MHHIPVFNRALLILLVMWIGATVVLLGCLTRRWQWDLQRKAAGFSMQCAGLLAPMDAADAIEFRGHQPGPVPCVSSRALGRVQLRSASLISFERTAEKGLVSVIIPSYNRAAIVGRAIESALGQSYKRLEVIVADDGSTDNTRSIVEAYGPRAVYVRQQNGGVSAARNFGMRHARGEFIAFLDSDDAWRPWKIEAQVAALSRNPRAGVVWTDMSAFNDDDDVTAASYLREMYSAYEKVDVESLLTPMCDLGALSATVPRDLAGVAVRSGDISSAILLGNLIHTSTVLFRRAWCERTGGFDESYERAGEDYEFYIRLTSAGTVVFIDAPTTLYRVGAADQLTAPSMLLEIARNNLRAVQKWLPPSSARIQLSNDEIRARFAESFAWLGEAELEAGHSVSAARRLSKSLAVRPGLDRRAVLLASCILPSRLRSGIRLARRAVLDGYSRSDSRAAT